MPERFTGVFNTFHNLSIQCHLSLRCLKSNEEISALCGATLLLYILHLQLLIPAEFLSADIKADLSDSKGNTSAAISIMI